MKKNAGITMISLAVMIVCMLILLAVTYRAGTMYIKETKQKEIEAVSAIISSYAIKRYEDNLVGFGPKDQNGNPYYEGYDLDSSKFQSLVSNRLTFDRYYCCALSASHAKALGVANAEDFLISDFNDPATNDKFVAIVNYKTGEVELLNYVDSVRNILR